MNTKWNFTPERGVGAGPHITPGPATWDENENNLNTLTFTPDFNIYLSFIYQTWMDKTSF